MESRQYTNEEVTEQFMSYVRLLIDYWDNIDDRSSRDKIEGFAHSMLCAIDGNAGALPAFSLIPYPHPDDKNYHIENGDNYYAESDDSENNISGGLHEMLYKTNQQ